LQIFPQVQAIVLEIENGKLKINRPSSIVIRPSPAFARSITVAALIIPKRDTLLAS